MPRRVVRREGDNDADQIRALLEQVFETRAEAEMVDALRIRDVNAISLVAEQQGVIVGHILFTEVVFREEPIAARAMGLAPLSVLPALQHQGIGTALVQAGLTLCRERAIEVVVVLGEPAYYQRFGFKKASLFGISNELGGASEDFMALELKPGALGRYRGTVRYQPEFSAAG